MPSGGLFDICLYSAIRRRNAILESQILCYLKYEIIWVYTRDGPDIRFSIRYPAKSGHFSAIRYPAGYWILKNWISGFRISGKPDISKEE